MGELEHLSIDDVELANDAFDLARAMRAAQ